MAVVRYRTCQACHKNRALKFYKKAGRVCLPCQKQRAARANKHRRLSETYGITIGEYDDILAHQGGVCAGCRGHRKVFDVDHDHAVEKVSGARASVRGLLCRSCNKILAYARDEPKRLRALSLYLEYPTAHMVIR